MAYLSDCGKCVRSGDCGMPQVGRGLTFLEEWPGSAGWPYSKCRINGQHEVAGRALLAWHGGVGGDGSCQNKGEMQACGGIQPSSINPGEKKSEIFVHMLDT